MTEQTVEYVDVLGDDISFDCPQCKRNLTIDMRGAGMMISCPHCQTRILVPDPVEGEEVPDTEQTSAETSTHPAITGQQEQLRALSNALDITQAEVRRLSAALDETMARRKYLEKLRVENMARFDVVTSELTMMQRSLDRVVSVLQDIVAGNRAPEKEG